jgi:hypothetical protein
VAKKGRRMSTPSETFFVGAGRQQANSTYDWAEIGSSHRIWWNCRVLVDGRIAAIGSLEAQFLLI